MSPGCDATSEIDVLYSVASRIVVEYSGLV